MHTWFWLYKYIDDTNNKMCIQPVSSVNNVQKAIEDRYVHEVRLGHNVPVVCFPVGAILLDGVHVPVVFTPIETPGLI